MAGGARDSQREARMNQYLESGSWFNKSRRALFITAALTALGFILFSAATEYFVAQYFICIGECRGSTPPLLLIVVSGLFAMIPVFGMAVLGYWIAKGLWDDARQVASEQAVELRAIADDKGKNPGRRNAPEASTGAPRDAEKPARPAAVGSPGAPR